MTKTFASPGEQVIHLLQHGDMSQKAIAQEVGVPLHIVHKLAQVYRTREQRRLYQGNSTPERRVTREWLIEHRFERGMTLQEMGDLLGITRERVRQILKREGLDGKIDLTQSYWRKTDGDLTEVNKHYFDVIDSEKKAYWLGYLTAKARIVQSSDHGRKSLHMSIAQNNLEHVKEFLREIEANVTIGTAISELRGKQYTTHKVTISSHHMASRLEEHYLVSPKHLNTKVPPTIPKEWIRHYFRGFYDGKGFLWKHKELDNKQMMFMFGSEQFLKQFKKHMLSTLGLKVRSKCIREDKDHNNYRFYLGDKVAIQSIWLYMYEGATIYHPRKVNQYHTIFGDGES